METEESTAVARIERPMVVQDIKQGAMSFDELQRLGKLLIQSKMFPGVTELSQACVKILAGAEMGFGPITSMTNIHVIKSQIQIGANLLAIKVREAGYHYRVRWIPDHRNPEACSIEFFRNGESLGLSEFSKENARSGGLAGKDNWKNYPRNMLFARAISNGVRWYCPEVVNATVYVPEEIETIKTVSPAEVATIDPSILRASTDENRGHYGTEANPDYEREDPEAVGAISSDLFGEVEKGKGVNHQS